MGWGPSWERAELSALPPPAPRTAYCTAKLPRASHGRRQLGARIASPASPRLALNKDPCIATELQSAPRPPARPAACRYLGSKPGFAQTRQSETELRIYFLDTAGTAGTATRRLQLTQTHFLSTSKSRCPPAPGCWQAALEAQPRRAQPLALCPGTGGIAGPGEPPQAHPARGAVRAAVCPATPPARRVAHAARTRTRSRPRA